MIGRKPRYRVWDNKNNCMYVDIKELKWIYYEGDYPEYDIYVDGNGLCGVNAVLMQFTGMQDKNCVDIWEGDILQTPHEKNTLVCWAGFGWMPYIRRYNTEPKYLLGFDVLVLGNIYEDPHLIKGIYDAGEMRKRK